MGNDINIKSNDKEFTRFKQFVEATAPYDLVVDALNVGFMNEEKNPRNQAKQVRREFKAKLP